MTVKAWGLGALALLIMLPVAVLVAVVALVDPDDLKPRLIDAVRDATGRTLDLDGKLRVTWFPWPTIQVNGARLSNLPGGSRADMARAERIEAQIFLPALLRRRIDVTRLTLVGPNVLFEVVNGKPNWVFTLPSTPGEPARSSAARFQLRIDVAHVQNGMVTWRLPARTHVVGLQTFDLRHPQDGALSLGGILVYGDNQPFTLHASARATAGLHGPWRTEIGFAAYDTDAHAHGTMTLAGDYDLDLDVRSGTLDKLNALLPEMRLPPVHGLVLSGHVTSNPVLGSLPVFGPLQLEFAAADLGRMLPGLQLGKTRLSLPAADGKATIASKTRYRGEDVTLTGMVGLPRRLEDRNDLPINLVAKARNESLSLVGKTTVDRLRFAGLDTTVSLRAPDLAALRSMLPAAVPALIDVRFDSRISVPADAGTIRLVSTGLTTRQGDLAGSGTIGLGGGGTTIQAIQAKLSSTRLDLDALLQAFGIGLSAAPNAGSVFDMPLPWTSTSGPKLDVAADVDAASFQKQVWRGAALTLRRDPDIQAADLRVAMPGGRAEVSVSANMSAGVPVRLSIHAPSIPLSLIARYADLPGTVVGAAQLEAELHGAGHTVRDLAASLNGGISIMAVDGRLTDAAFIRLTSGWLQPLGIKVPAQGETILRCFGVIGTAADGVLRLRTIALDSTYLTLNGTGEVDFGRQTIALKLHPLVRVGGSPVAVPVVVEGPFNAITGRLDATGLDKVGLLIDGLFGGDKPETCSEAGLVPAQSSSSRKPS